MEKSSSGQSFELEPRLHCSVPKNPHPYPPSHGIGGIVCAVVGETDDFCSSFLNHCDPSVGVHSVCGGRIGGSGSDGASRRGMSHFAL